MRRWLPALILLLPLAALLPFSMVEPDGTEAPAHPRAGPDLFTDPATWDATYEKAHAAYKAEEYQTAIALLLPIAIDGHAPSQTLFGYMQELGLGMSKNACYARIWYDRAARAGHPEAQLLLGAYYNAIYGRQPNLRLYYYWVMMADRNGFDPARSISGATIRSIISACSKRSENGRTRRDCWMTKWSPGSIRATCPRHRSCPTPIQLSKMTWISCSIF